MKIKVYQNGKYTGITAETCNYLNFISSFIFDTTPILNYPPGTTAADVNDDTNGEIFIDAEYKALCKALEKFNQRYKNKGFIIYYTDDCTLQIIPDNGDNVFYQVAKALKFEFAIIPAA